MNRISKPALLAIAALIACALSLPASAQHIDVDVSKQSNPIWYPMPRAKFLAGPRMALNRNFHSGGFRAVDGATCPLFTNGTGWGYGGGVTAEFIPGRSWGIITALSYESRPGSFNEMMPAVPVLLEGEIVPVDQTIEAASDVTYRIAGAEVLYKQEFLQLGRSLRLSVAAGPAASIVLDSRRTQVQDLITPLNARFRNPGNKGYPNELGGRRQVFAKNDRIEELSAMRLSLKGGVQAEVGLFNNAIIMYPGVFFDYGLTTVTSSENWDLHSLLFQLDFRRAF